MKQELQREPERVLKESGGADEKLTLEKMAKEPVDVVASALDTDLNIGLSAETAAVRLLRQGPNAISRAPSANALKVFVQQFRSTVVYVLGAASIVSFLNNEVVQAGAILAAVIINAVVGFITEYKAKVSLDALEALAGPVARVRRDGIECEIPAADLVPGDLLILEAGSRVPADVRIVKSGALSVDESALSGESIPVYKNAQIKDAESGTVAYQGSMIMQGNAKAVVVCTGASTRLGQLGVQLSQIESSATPLERSLEQLGRQLSLLTLFVCAALLCVGIWHKEDAWIMLQTSIALAVAAIPEGLPVVATLALAVGTQRMVKLGALVRKLSAVETLGCTGIICTDKTGTLTQNQMTVTDLVFDSRDIRVSGIGYSPEGEIHENGLPLRITGEPVLCKLLIAAALCNDAKVENHGGDDPWHVHGDPTEGALITAAHKAQLKQDELKSTHRRVHELPFDLERKRMTTIHKSAEDDELTAFVKGSPESIIAVSSSYLTCSGIRPLSEDKHTWFLQRNAELAARGLRVLGVAFKRIGADKPVHQDHVESELVFLGLIAMADQPKEGVRESIEQCQRAGIKVLMLTGDQSATATAIARELGIIGAQADGAVASGAEIENLEAQQFKDSVRQAQVLARVKPEMKHKIVQTLQSLNQVVAMTGDGVNDAAALRQADIGIAMGRAGTALAREASDMVITDDNFATIVKAIEEGRGIYRNIASAIAYLLTASVASVFTVAAAVLLDSGMPLSPLQLLLLNLIMHVFPALGLALQRPSGTLMEEPPREAGKPLLDRSMWMQIVIRAALVSAGASITTFCFAGESESVQKTLVLGTLSVSLLLQSWSWFFVSRRTFKLFPHCFAFNTPMVLNSMLGLSLLFAALYVPALKHALATAPLSLHHWFAVCTTALATFACSLLVTGSSASSKASLS